MTEVITASNKLFSLPKTKEKWTMQIMNDLVVFPKLLTIHNNATSYSVNGGKNPFIFVMSRWLKKVVWG